MTLGGGVVNLLDIQNFARNEREKKEFPAKLAAQLAWDSMNFG